MMKWRAGAALGAAIALLSACAAPSGSGYDPATQARIRVYHGASAYLIIDDGCGRKESIHAAAGGFSYLTPNKTLGMPRPSSMPSYSFHEYAVPEGKTVTVSMLWQMQDASGIWRRCGPQQLSFTPRAGQDYETFMRIESWGCQGLELRRLVPQTDGRIDFDRVQLNGVAASRGACSARSVD